MMKSVRHDPARFEVSDEKLRPFEKLMMTLEGQVLDGFVFQVGQGCITGLIYVINIELFVVPQ